MEFAPTTRHLLRGKIASRLDDNDNNNNDEEVVDAWRNLESIKKKRSVESPS